LGKFSDRYRIRRDGEERLSLQIEDLHQAGTRRPMASLSGGESFLVSLSLALGLSDLAGRTVRIDSLFIDEGFGSLDSETLETAISALESLQLSRKTVGVISHVNLLKERIATRIVVEKLPGAWSRIQIEG
jgi:exonuclease SbcC